MISQLHIGAIVLVAVFIISAIAWVRDDYFLYGPLGYITFLIAGVSIAVAIFNFWLWRVRWLQGWFVKRPHLWGKWDILISPEGTDPATGEKFVPVMAEFRVRQTYGALYVHMIAPQSTGDLLSAELIHKEDGGCRLVGVFRNEPKFSERPSLEIHHGAFLLDIEGPPNSPSGMIGHYWTDRGTSGEMTATNRQSDK